MASSVKSALDIAKAAQERAATQAQPAKASPQYKELFGPCEVAGGHGDAYIVQSPSGVEYVEYRPRGGGRMKRVQLTAVTALFPHLLTPPKE
jgi:hypothetical protein